jgi:hypothetical protein
VDYDFDFMEVARSLGVYSVAVPNPGAGLDWSYTLPAPARVLSVAASFVASGAAATRYPFLNLAGGDLIQTPFTPAGITAGQAFNLYCTLDGPTPPVAAAGALPSGSKLINSGLTPSALLPAGSQVGSLTGGLQAADQWEGIVLTLAPI